VCLLRGTDWVFKYNSTFCPHSVFMSFVWISEQAAIISLYSINWLVFITETECVYCAVRAGSLNSTFCPHSVFMCFVWISEKQFLFPHTALCFDNRYSACLLSGKRAILIYNSVVLVGLLKGLIKRDSKDCFHV
jgi:hypothetical protein